MENLPDFEPLPDVDLSGSPGKKSPKSKQGNRKSGDRRRGDRRRGRLKWHPAFLQAMQMELFDYRDFLEFKYEHQLTAEPLRIDLLIIKKPKDLAIDKNIARIFRSDNIIEYKSPEDYISIKDFLKVYAYANLYAAITPNVDLSEVTLTFVESRHPRKLLKYLSEIRGYKVEETSPGIYLVRGDYLPIQIIESKKLSEGENLWLNSLRDDLKNHNISSILNKGREQAEKSSIAAYVDIIIRANEKLFSEAKNMWEDTLFEICERNGIVDEWKKRTIKESREKGLEQGLLEGKLIIAKNLLAKGMSCEFVQEITGLDMEKIKAFSN
jgi:hypothetical protein